MLHAISEGDSGSDSVAELVDDETTHSTSQATGSPCFGHAQVRTRRQPCEAHVDVLVSVIDSCNLQLMLRYGFRISFEFKWSMTASTCGFTFVLRRTTPPQLMPKSAWMPLTVVSMAFPSEMDASVRRCGVMCAENSAERGSLLLCAHL